MQGKHRKIIALGILFIFAGFIKGLFCMGTNVPWQAADEVTHFEAAVLRAGQWHSKASPIPGHLLQKKIS